MRKYIILILGESYRYIFIQLMYKRITFLILKERLVMTATRGLEGVIATESSISSIIDDKLTYAGYSIDDLAENASFEEIVYLLWNRELPTQDQLNELSTQLANEME